MRIEYDPVAIDQAMEAATWYRAQRESLGAAFVAELSATVSLLNQAPYAQVVRGAVRSRLMRRFPYRVFFTVDAAAQRIVIVAVLHAARDPDLWP